MLMVTITPNADGSSDNEVHINASSQQLAKELMLLLSTVVVNDMLRTKTGDDTIHSLNTIITNIPEFILMNDMKPDECIKC